MLEEIGIITHLMVWIGSTFNSNALIRDYPRHPREIPTASLRLIRRMRPTGNGIADYW